VRQPCPYGEDWIDDKASTATDSIAYKFTGKEYDSEMGYTNYGARYYDMKLSTWISADKAFVESKYFPKATDFDTEHDYYWYLKQDASNKLPGIGGVFNSVNLNVYAYAGLNPVKHIDPDGNLWAVMHFLITFQVALEEGHSLKDTLKYATEAYIADAKELQGLTADKTRIHAMSGKKEDGSYQSRIEAIKETHKFIDETKKTHKGVAIHAAQDLETPDYKGKEWKGFGFNKETVKHIVGDVVPTQETADKIYDTTRSFLRTKGRGSSGTW
jgi:RHS repeat-associated protein